MRRLFPLALLLSLIPLVPRSIGGAPQETSNATIFHHVHLNSIDPSKAIDFYTRTFDVTKKTRIAGFDGIQSENIYLLFNKASSPPRTSPDSAIWHFGWGSAAIEAISKNHRRIGLQFKSRKTKLG